MSPLSSLFIYLFLLSLPALPISSISLICPYFSLSLFLSPSLSLSPYFSLYPSPCALVSLSYSSHSCYKARAKLWTDAKSFPLATTALPFRERSAGIPLSKVSSERQPLRMDLPCPGIPELKTYCQDHWLKPPSAFLSLPLLSPSLPLFSPLSTPQTLINQLPREKGGGGGIWRIGRKR